MSAVENCRCATIKLFSLQLTDLHRSWVVKLENLGTVSWRTCGREIAESVEACWRNGSGQLINAVIPALLGQGMGGDTTLFIGSIKQIVEPLQKKVGGEHYLARVAARLKAGEWVGTVCDDEKKRLRSLSNGKRPPKNRITDLAAELIYPGPNFDRDDCPIPTVTTERSAPGSWRRAIGGMLSGLVGNRPRR